MLVGFLLRAAGCRSEMRHPFFGVFPAAWSLSKRQARAASARLRASTRPWLMVACRPSQREKSQSAKPRMTAVTPVAARPWPRSMNGKLTAAPTRPAMTADTTIPRGPLQRGESNRATRRTRGLRILDRLVHAGDRVVVARRREFAGGLDLGASHAAARQERPGFDVECRDPLGPGSGLALERFESVRSRPSRRLRAWNQRARAGRSVRCGRVPRRP